MTRRKPSSWSSVVWILAAALRVALPALAAAQAAPAISGATPRFCLSEQFCVCGFFPTEAAANGLSIGGIPLGPPISRASHVLWFAAPPVLAPGMHTVTGAPAAGFTAGSSAQVEVLGIEAWIDSDTIEVGAGTTLRVAVRGTTQPIGLRLTNTTPGTVTLDGGVQIDVKTSGGTQNEAPVAVTGVKPGPFAIDYLLSERQPCPCDPNARLPTVWQPPDRRWTLSTGLRYDPEDLGPPDSAPPTPAPPDTAPAPPTPTDSLPPAPSDSMPPRDSVPSGGRPPPTPTPPIECSVTRVEGKLTPSQGVWPDDPVFEDKPTKQIVQMAPNAYRNELKMVKGRRTLIFGIERPMPSMGTIPIGGSSGGRDQVYIAGVTNGTNPVPVSMRFTLKQSGTQRVVYDTEILGQVWLGGPCRPGAEQPFRIAVPEPVVHNGLPAEGSGFTPFTFDQTGAYIIEAELLAYGSNPTGIKAGVFGDVVETHAPSIAFLPAVISTSTDSERADLVKYAQTMDARAVPLMTEFLPLAPTRPVSTVLELENLSAFSPDLPLFLLPAHFHDSGFVAELTRRFDAGARLSSFDRVLVIMRPSDFDQLFFTSDYAAAYASSQKVIFWHTRDGRLSTLSHEVVHTLPYPWAFDEEEAECEKGYHGTTDTQFAHGHAYANGLNGAPGRSRHDGINSLQDYGEAALHRTNQCTFWHILGQLQAGAPDPPVILVQGLVARDSTGVFGGLGPLYQVDGVVDLPRLDDVGEWAIVLRDAKQAPLGRFPFRPVWQAPDQPVPRSVVGFSYRVPDVAGVAQVDLVGPGEKVLHSVRYSANRPSVRVIMPADGAKVVPRDGRVRIEWEANDPDGDEVLATVLYSPDDGRTWRTVAFEIAEPTYDVPIAADVKSHRVIVRVTDGARSTDATTTFTTR